MKRSYATLIACLTLLAACRNHAPDAVEKANNLNHNNEPGKFLAEVTDGRLMDIREAEEAVKKGTTADIRAYGALMLQEQKGLLVKLTGLATEYNVVLPQDISDQKSRGFKDLDEKQGKDFDNKFIKMMTRDHERDIRIVKKGLKSRHLKIREFASSTLPAIQSHLDKIKAIRNEKK